MVITLNSDLRLLQEIRLIQALSESAFKVSVKESDLYKLSPIINKFNICFVTNQDIALDFKKITSIDHSIPISSIGNINRNLIFPHNICTHLKDNWNTKRKLQFSFSGFVSVERKKEIFKWIDLNRNRNLFILINRILLMRFLSLGMWRIKNLIGSSKSLLVEINFSSKGRKFPGKTWDRQYYNTLLNSEFVLCPSGDYIWTYRFFESILAGAIPVIEAECDAYKGFRYRFMHEDIKDFVWTKEDADYNYELCLSKITIPLAILNEELNKLKKDSENYTNKVSI
ncbi:exostosin family protein [Gillisia sp. CAL575]|uniref:exostosin domain-containing protein n=1 Tax=Gillisia sp. CAL575 TaxID=985255 RepID=UPI0003A724DB|nr:exostosin family protein [Gillisia sp. CAL575]